MGLETSTTAELVKINDLAQMRMYLEKAGWEEVNFGFHLGRYTEALDFQRLRERNLCYKSNAVDRYSYQNLTSNQIVRFPTIYTPGDPDKSIGISGIPPVTRALDSLSYPDQQPHSDYLGSFEIFVSIAKFLTEIYKKTGTVPQDLKLSNLSLIVGTPDIIRLIPPLNLQSSTDWTPLADQLYADLMSQDPHHNHQGQIETFNNHFNIFLKNA